MLKKKHTSRFWECDGQFCLMTRKGVYPYEYMDNWKKLEEISLPRKDAFYSRLNMKGISDQDFEHTQQVWNNMEKKTLGFCHDTCLKTDVLLLADVFETFRDTCLENYKLDPAYFYIAPRLARLAPSAVSMKKGGRTVNYVPTSSGLSCLGYGHRHAVDG